MEWVALAVVLFLLYKLVMGMDQARNERFERQFGNHQLDPHEAPDASGWGE